MLTTCRSKWTIDCISPPPDYPIGIYLGPNSLTSAYYTSKDEPVLVADTEADPVWTARTLTRMLEGQRICWDWEGERDEQAGPCDEILPAFLASMTRIVQATSDQLNRRFSIGYVVIPTYLRDYIPFMDEAMRTAFNFTHNPQLDDGLMEYNVVELSTDAQYGYGLTAPQDRWGSRDSMVVYDSPGPPAFDEDDHIIYVNIENEFLEVGYRCLSIWCSAPTQRKIVAQPGQLEHSPDLLAQVAIDIRPPTSLIFGTIVYQIARHIADFTTETPFEGEHGRLRAVVLTGAAHSDLTIAASMALPHAFPNADPALFLTYKDTKFVPSLGAAQMIRNQMVRARSLELSMYCGLSGYTGASGA